MGGNSMEMKGMYIRFRHAFRNPLGGKGSLLNINVANVMNNLFNEGSPLGASMIAVRPDIGTALLEAHMKDYCICSLEYVIVILQ